MWNHDRWMTFLHQDCRFPLVEAKHQANDNDSFDDSRAWRVKSKLMRRRPLLWDWQSNHCPRTSHVSTTVCIIFLCFPGEKQSVSAERHWCIVGFDFSNLGCCKSSGEPNSAGQRLSEEPVSQNDSRAHSLQARSISPVPGPYGKAQPFPFAGHECCPVPFPRHLSGGSA